MNTSFEYKNVFTSIEDAIDADMMILRRLKDCRLANHGHEAFEYVTDALNLEPFLEVFATFNTSNFSRRQGFRHAVRVLLNCYEGAYHERLGGDELRGLCIGALFHDFNRPHAGSAGTDPNASALAGLYSAQAFAKSQQLGLSPTALSVAKSVLSIVHCANGRQPQSLVECVMSDAHRLETSGNPVLPIPMVHEVSFGWQTRWGVNKGLTRRSVVKGPKGWLGSRLDN